MNIENVNFSPEAERAILNLALKVELKVGQRFRATKSLDALSQLDQFAKKVADTEIRDAYAIFRATISPGHYAVLSAKQAPVFLQNPPAEKEEAKDGKRRMVYRGRETWV